MVLYKYFIYSRFNMQSGIWRGNYGEQKAHTTAVRGVACDSLNQIAATGCSEGKIKFWNFKIKSK